MQLESDEWTKKENELSEKENEANKLLKNLTERNQSLINDRKDLNKELGDKTNEIEKLCMKIISIEREASELREFKHSSEKRSIEIEKENQNQL